MSFLDRCLTLLVSSIYVYYIILYIIISLNVANSEELLELSCVASHDCKQFERSGVNVTCINGQCRCSSETGDLIKCSPTDLKQSNIIGGPCPCRIPDAECNELQKICYCAKEFMASVDKRQCLRETVALEGKCELDSQCQAGDHHSFCDHGIKKCKCRQNFVLHNGTCVSVADPSSSCKSNKDCERYGAHVTCMVETEKCTCLIGYIKALNKTECINVASYRQNCTEHQQCQTHLGPGGACIDGLCDCSGSHYLINNELETEDKNNVTQAICARIIEIGEYCREDRDCYHHQLPDEEQTMSCFYGECNCKWGFNSINNMECIKGSDGNALSPTLTCIFLSLFSIIGAYI